MKSLIFASLVLLGLNANAERIPMVCDLMKAADVSEFKITGFLTRKGPDRFSVWAITTASGKEWDLKNLTPDQENLIFYKIQNQQVTAKAVCLGQHLFDEISISDVTIQGGQ